MHILVIGSGGREHALIWKLSQSKLADKIYAAPGNGGIAEMAECVDIKADDVNGLLRFAQEKNIDLTVVGPEVPLVAGIVDVFEKEGLKIFGPSKAAAQLEGSKTFAKEFMSRHSIPTAEFAVFADSKEAKEYLKKASVPLVIKADGLAAGKGVVICTTKQEAEDAIDLIMEKKAFRDAGSRVVIEECLQGEEASILAIADGSNFVMIDSSQDHKRIFDEDKGPNTGGMGAYSPAPVISRELFQQIASTVMRPVIDGMKKEGNVFKGVLYAGLMITKEGPKVLEFNVRFGDPETQAILPRLQSDLVEVILASIDGNLDNVTLEWDKRACVCVVMASGGYPGSYEKGKVITGLDQAKKIDDVIVFHAGTQRQNDTVVTSGGRVLGVTGLGNGIKEAIDATYQAVEKINFEKRHYRKDIGFRALSRNETKIRSTI
ncbi:phosphoribosylamine--glycine ligase [Candidatus Omnitrophota bacterium]